MGSGRRLAREAGQARALLLLGRLGPYFPAGGPQPKGCCLNAHSGQVGPGPRETFRAIFLFLAKWLMVPGAREGGAGPTGGEAAGPGPRVWLAGGLCGLL